MVYLWVVEVNGTRFHIKAIKSYTAISRALDGKETRGNITFSRLRQLRRKRCAVCGYNYEDSPEGRKHHFEVYYFHKRAVEELKEKGDL